MRRSAGLTVPGLQHEEAMRARRIGEWAQVE
jgi:hypothetical protein